MMLERRFDLLDYRFAFRSNSARAVELLSTLYRGFEHDLVPPVEHVYELTESGGSHWTIAAAGLTPSIHTSLGSALNALEADIVSEVARRRSSRHLIHGATVYGPTGDILITGPSGAGKTTLSLALTTRGFRVGSDDLAALDPATNTVQPLPRCFHLDQQSRTLLAEIGVTLPADALKDSFVTPAHLWPPASPAPIQFMFFLETQRQPRPQIDPETQAAMAAALLLETGCGHFSYKESVSALGRLVGRCRCFRLWSASVQTTVDEVARIVGR
jgi:hypothetical protein